MRWILAACGALFLANLLPIGRVAAGQHCAIYHPGDPWNATLVATVVSDAVIAACYFGIPAHFVFWALRLWRDRLPAWLALLGIAFACFVLSCGLTHVDAVFARPIVYCTESLLIKLETAAFSLVSLAACAICTEPLLLLAGMVSRSPVFGPILRLSSPFETAAVLRRLLKESNRG